MASVAPNAIKGKSHEDSSEFTTREQVKCSRKTTEELFDDDSKRDRYTGSEKIELHEVPAHLVALVNPSAL